MSGSAFILFLLLVLDRAQQEGGRCSVNQENRPGYYRDRDGKWQKDRRKSASRRNRGAQLPMDHERRKHFRRKEDQEILERDHKPMINDALDEFAEEHDGHL